MLDGEPMRNASNYLWEDGCCIDCKSHQQIDGCWCSNVKCHQCDWYEGYSEDEEGNFRFQSYKKGWCTFPSSVFDVPNLEKIIKETEKAYYIEIKDYPPFWLPKKSCQITTTKGIPYLSIKGWIILLKIKEYDGENDDPLWHLFFDATMNYLGDDF
jgi:hypothetical protein